MSDNLKRFLAYVSEHQDAFPKINDMTKAQIIASAKEKGFALVMEDFACQTEEISDDELDVVAGGAGCICSFGGGGKADEDSKTCACVMGGSENKNGSTRCVCIVGGHGEWQIRI